MKVHEFKKFFALIKLIRKDPEMNAWLNYLIAQFIESKLLKFRESGIFLHQEKQRITLCKTTNIDKHM